MNLTELKALAESKLNKSDRSLAPDMNVKMDVLAPITADRFTNIFLPEVEFDPLSVLKLIEAIEELRSTVIYYAAFYENNPKLENEVDRIVARKSLAKVEEILK